jgi:hypothetical protein
MGLPAASFLPSWPRNRQQLHYSLLSGSRTIKAIPIQKARAFEAKVTTLKLRLGHTRTASKNKNKKIDHGGTPTLLPQTLQVPGAPGPMTSLRSQEIPFWPQCGQRYMQMLHWIAHLTRQTLLFPIRTGYRSRLTSFCVAAAVQGKTDPLEGLGQVKGIRHVWIDEQNLQRVRLELRAVIQFTPLRTAKLPIA